MQQLIVQRFLAWARSVGSEERAKGVADLTLAYLHGGLHEAERQEILTVLTALLDDPSPLVKRAIAEILAARDDVPHHIIMSLANDLADISTLVLRQSPILTASELVDFVRMGAPNVHMAVAQRAHVPAAVAMALIEHAQADVIMHLVYNEGADLSEACLLKILELYGADGAFREAILARSDVPHIVRLDLVATTAQVLSSFVEKCQWMSQERSERMALEATEHATLVITNEIAAENYEQIFELVTHLRRAGRLTAGLMMRALLFGERRLFETALSVLSGQPLGRVQAMVRSPYGSAFTALYNKVSMPEGLMPAFQIALKEADTEGHFVAAGPSRKMIAAILTICEQLKSAELASLAYRLRRLDAEAARQHVRLMNQSTQMNLAPEVQIDHELDDDQRKAA